MVHRPSAIHPHHQRIPSPHWVISGSNISPNLATRLPSLLTTPIANPPTPSSHTVMYHVSIQVRAMLYAAPRESHGPRAGDQPMGRGAEKGAYVVCPGKFGIVGTPIRPWPCPTYRCRFTALNSGLPSLVIIHGRPVPRFGFRMNIN